MLSIVLVLILVGFVLWIVKSAIPMDPMMSNLISGVVVIIALIWVLNALGYGHSLGFR